MKNFFVFLFYFAFLALSAQKKEFEFLRITELDGLSNSNVRDFFKDSNGFLWVATRDGLNQFDGKNFRIYRNQLDEPNSLSDNSINTIYQDSYGLLWVGTDAGLNSINLKTNEITRYVKDLENPEAIAGDRIQHILEDFNSDLWIGFDNDAGLDKWSREKNQFTNYDLFDLFPASEYGVFHQAIRDMTIDPVNEKLLWLGTTGGLLSFNMDTEKFVKHQHPVLSAENRNFSAWAIGWEKDNLLRVGFFGIGTDVFNTTSNSWKKSYSPPERGIRIYDMAKKSENEFWVAVRKKGLGILNTDTDKIDFIPSKINDNRTPFPGFTGTVFADGEKLWVGGKYGISYLDPTANLFALNPLEFHSSEYGRVTEISADDSTFFIGTVQGNGVWSVDKRSSETKNIYSEDKLLGVSCIKDAGDNVFFFIMERASFYVYSKKTGKTTAMKILGDSSLFRGNFYVNDFVFINDNEALVATEFHGTIKLNVTTGHAESYLDSNEEPVTYNLNWHIEPMPDGTFWIGCPKGIAIYDPEKNSFDFSVPQYLLKEKNKRVTTVKNHPSGIFIGTTSGLILLRDKSEQLLTTSNSDLQGNEILEIKLDDNNKVWVSTRKGISRIDPSTLEILNYNRSDGLDQNGSFGPIGGGYFYVSNEGGYSLFHTDSLTRYAKPPETYFTSFQLASPNFNSHHVNFEEPINISYKENSFSLSYTSPVFTNPHKIKFAYKMNGANTDWVVTNNRKITFSNLTGGSHKILAKTMNGDRVWGSPKSVTIVIQPPFWKTWWFIALSAILGVAIIYVLSRYRLKRILKEQKRTAEIEVQELRVEAMKKRLFELNSSPPDLQLVFKELNLKLQNALTEREFQTLELSVKGLSNNEISEQLFVSLSTVKFHMGNVFIKLGVTNRKEALKYIVKKT